MSDDIVYSSIKRRACVLLAIVAWQTQNVLCLFAFWRASSNNNYSELCSSTLLETVVPWTVIALAALPSIEHPQQQQQQHLSFSSITMSQTFSSLAKRKHGIQQPGSACHWHWRRRQRMTLNYSRDTPILLARKPSVLYNDHGKLTRKRLCFFLARTCRCVNKVLFRSFFFIPSARYPQISLDGAVHIHETLNHRWSTVLLI